MRFPDAAGLRPTPDRVRETLFNWLGQRLDGLACLDLFAGSGALGFEALSRGAARVVMVERDREVLRAAAALRPRELGGAEGLEVVQADALAWLARARRALRRRVRRPALRERPRRAGAAPLLGRACNPGARVYVEARRAARAPSARWRVLREDRAGAVRFALYEFAASRRSPQETP